MNQNDAKKKEVCTIPEGFCLRLKDYCSNCEDFEVEDMVIDASRAMDGRFYCSHIIKCKNSDKCERIRERLEERICTQ